MKKTAVLFPGQGSQFYGMGKTFYDNFISAKHIYEEASYILKIDMTQLCFTENEKLNMTIYTQPALLTTQTAIDMCLREQGIIADYYAGLSCGEYSAIVACGGMTFSDALQLVQKRGMYMQSSVPSGKGKMSAIIGLKNELVEEVCKSISPTLTISNYNCPGQVVIAGYTKDVEKANAKFDELGAVAIRPLNISVPSHCFLQKKAAEELETALRGITVNHLKTPYISNVTANEVTDYTNIKSLLVQQLYSPVKWQQTLEYLVKKEVDIFFEIQSDTSLKLMKYINRKIKVISVNDVGDINGN